MWKMEKINKMKTLAKEMIEMMQTSKVDMTAVKMLISF